jgi:hypothetical protein
VSRGLDGKAPDGAHEWRQEALEAGHAAKAAVSDTAVDHGDRQLATAGGAQHERPVVALGEDQAARLEAAEEALDGESELEGQIGDGGSVAE